jgi:hypothetical protein
MALLHSGIAPKSVLGIPSIGCERQKNGSRFAVRCTKTRGLLAFLLAHVKIFRRSGCYAEKFMTRPEQNFLALARSWKSQHALTLRFYIAYGKCLIRSSARHQCFAAELWPRKWKFAEGAKITPFALLIPDRRKHVLTADFFALCSMLFIQNLYELERNAEQTYESLVLHCKLKR